MKAVATMIAASLAAAMAAIAIAGRGVRADVLLGMLAPLGAAGL